MRVFLTGATGYIGHVVAEMLQRADHEVLGLARSDESARKLEAQGHDVARGGLADADTLSDAARATDATIHLAATGDERQAELDERAVEAMLDALEGSGKPFIYTSGIWVLGATGDEPADEDAQTNPIPIVAYRPALERQVLDAGERDVRGVVIRPAIVYGRGGGIPGMLVDGGREHGAVRYIGDGAQRWPFVHIDDLADLYVRSLDAPAGTLLHAADGPAHPVRDVAEAAAEAAGVDGETASWPLRQAREELGVFADALAVDQQVTADRARELLDWSPQAASVLEDLRSGSYTRLEEE